MTRQPRWRVGAGLRSVVLGTLVLGAVMALGVACQSRTGLQAMFSQAGRESVPSLGTTSPRLAAGSSPAASCLPAQPSRDLSPEVAPAVGRGPAFAVVGDVGRIRSIPDGHGGWTPAKVLWVAERSHGGRTVIRGIDLTGAPSGVMTRLASGALSPVLAIDWTQVRVSPRSGLKEVPSSWTVPRPGCFGWVIKSPDGQDVIWYEVVVGDEAASLHSSPGL